MIAPQVVISPWGSLEADCLREMLRHLSVVPSSELVESSAAYVLTVPRKFSPAPIELPDAIEERGVPVLLIVDTIVPWSIALARSVGASRMVSWSDGKDAIIAALRDVLWGRAARSTVRPSRSDPLSRLTDREREVMTLVTKGQPDEMIASHLGISVNTVRSHLQHCLTKLEVAHRHAAATLVRNDRQVRGCQEDVTVVPRPRKEP